MENFLTMINLEDLYIKFVEERATDVLAWRRMTVEQREKLLMSQTFGFKQFDVVRFNQGLEELPPPGAGRGDRCQL